MPDTTANAQQRLLQELVVFFDPIARAVQGPEEAYALLRATGWTPTALLGAAGAAFLDALTQTAGAVQAIQQALSTPPQSLADFEAALARVEGAVNSLRALPSAMGSGQPPELQRLPADLLEVLGLTYLQRRAPSALPILRALTIIRTEALAPVSTAGKVLRPGGMRERLDLGRLPALVSDPLGQLRMEYLPNGLPDAATTDAVAARLLPRLAGVFTALGADTVVGRGNSPSQVLPSTEAALAHSLTVAWPLPVEIDDVGTRLELGFTLRLVAADENGAAGVLLAPFGEAALMIALSEAWRLTLGASATVSAALITRAGVQLPAASAGPPQIALTVVLEKLGRDGDPALCVGSMSGTRLEVGRLRLTAAGTFDPKKPAYGFLLEAASGALIIAPGDSDGFLQQILPRDGLRTDFDLALGWSNDRGLYLRGGAGLDATLPVHRDLAGLLRIETVSLAVRADGAGLRALAGLSVSVRLGPVTVSVEDIGLQAFVTFPSGGGNAGLADLQLRVKPPNGAALKIDAGVVVGGGYLFFDPVKAEYAGAVQLRIGERVSLVGFGLLTTRMPDGSPGFSLLVLMAARFDPPIALGYGFSLEGVGGLVGVNRTVAVDVLRAGLRAGTLGSILFPAVSEPTGGRGGTAPIRNAPQIVSDLAAVFPPAEGRFLFGPMAMLSWGTPTLLTMELGLVLELPAPVQLIILGRLRVLLPDKKQPVVRLQLDALGVIDFESGDVALDAALYQSEVAGFQVTGQMALRANFGVSPGFVLAVGGFHPRFAAPSGFPALERVAISLAAGDNPRLRLEAYLAVTTNTVQLGARLELYVKIAGITLEGLLAFDTLISFDPFGFVAEAVAAVAVTCFGIRLAVIAELTLTGPAPWHAWVRASFRLPGVNFTVRHAMEIGRAQAPELPAQVRIRPLLLAALKDEGNWITQLPEREHAVVTLRAQPASADTLVHPLADLQVSQRVVPLGLVLTRFGNTSPDGERRFALSVVGGAGAGTVSDFFAPAQYRDMSDDEKLAAPAFERLPAGIRLAARGYACGAAVVEPQIVYETKTVYGAAMAARPSGPPPLYAATTALVEQVAPAGAAGLAPRRHTATARYRPEVATRGFALKEPVYAVAASADGAPASPVAPSRFSAFAASAAAVAGTGGGEPLSYMAAAEALRQRLAAHPEERARLRVVPYLAGVAA